MTAEVVRSVRLWDVRSAGLKAIFRQTFRVLANGGRSVAVAAMKRALWYVSPEVFESVLADLVEAGAFLMERDVLIRSRSRARLAAA